jgi:hypothetical protein
MNEAERFLAAKMTKKEDAFPTKVSPTQSTPTGCTGNGLGAPNNPAPPPKLPSTCPPPLNESRPGPKASDKTWQVVMTIFAILATMFWMAVFKGGCR